MSNSTTSTSTQPPSNPSGLQPSNAVISPVRYDHPNFLPSVTSTHSPSPAPYEPSALSNLPYPMHRERPAITQPPPRPVISDTLTLDKEPPPSSHPLNNSLPTVGPELLNNEVIISNQQPVVSEAPQETDNSGALVPGSKTGQTYVDITEYLNMPQSEAAKKLGIPTSTLSKRWKEAVRGRKWPYRMICKLDKEIMTLLHNVPQGTNGAGVTPPFPEDMENTLTRLIRLRNEELKSVVIRI